MTPWTEACQAPVLHCLPEFVQTHDMRWMSSILCRPLLLTSILPSIRVFSNELTLHIRGTEFSPAPQLESINSWALGLLYGPTVTSVYDYWKNQYSFDYIGLCQQSDASAF